MKLREGVSQWNLSIALYGSFATIGATAFLGFIQPYLFNEVFFIPVERQGSLTGSLQTVQEVVVVLLTGLAGVLSDRLGRRFLWISGLLIMAAVYVVYPMAQSESQLFLFRIVLGAGTAIGPIMMLACLFDYTEPKSHGRVVGINAVAVSLGVLAMAVGLSRLPAWFVGLGYDAGQAGVMAMWAVAGIFVSTALILRAGLLGPDSTQHKEGEGSFRKLVIGFRKARSNPRLSLAMSGAFIGRGDFTVVAIFFSLWIVQAGADSGMESGEALVLAGKLFGVVQGTALVWAYGMGRICDRVSPVVGLAIAATLGFAGYFVMGAFGDPLSSSIYPMAILLGIGEISVVVASSSLLGKSAPNDGKGAVVGIYGLIGGIGILTVSFVGGELFDSVSRVAPFLMMAVMNLLLVVGAILVSIDFFDEHTESRKVQN